MKNQPKVICGHCGREAVMLGQACPNCGDVPECEDQHRLVTPDSLRRPRRLLSDRIFQAVITIGVQPIL